MNQAWIDNSMAWLGPLGSSLGGVLLHAIPWALLLGFVGTLIAVFVCVLFYKRGLLKRNRRGWNIACKLWYVAIVVVLSGAGCASGAALGVQREVHAIVDEEVRPALEKNMPTLHEFLTEKLDVNPDQTMTSEQAAGRLLEMLYYEPKSDGAIDKGVARSVNWFTLNFGKWVITAAVGAMVAYAVGRTGDTLGLSKGTIEFTVNTIKDMDLSKADDTIVKIALDALLAQVDGYFNSIYLTLLAAVAALALLLGAEIFVYRRYFMNRQPSP